MNTCSDIKLGDVVYLPLLFTLGSNPSGYSAPGINPGSIDACLEDGRTKARFTARLQCQGSLMRDVGENKAKPMRLNSIS